MKIFLEKTNFVHFVSFPLGENLLKHLFLQKLEILNALKLQQLENANFTHFSYARLVKTIQIPILTKVKDFQSCGASRAWKGKFSHFVSSPLREKYPKTSFVKSRCFRKQEDDKMKYFFQSHFLTNIFKPCSWNWCRPYWELIQSSLQGGPFGGPACPPVRKYCSFYPILAILLVQIHKGYTFQFVDFSYVLIKKHKEYRSQIC